MSNKVSWGNMMRGSFAFLRGGGGNSFALSFPKMLVLALTLQMVIMVGVS